MAADTTIAALFDLPVVAPPLCDKSSCKSVVGYISKFFQDVEKGTSHPWIDKAELRALDIAMKTLQATNPHKNIDWIPDYGCALMKSAEGCQSGEVALNLIALDLHRFQTTSKLSSSGYDYIDTAFSMDYEVLPIGVCTLEELPQRQSTFRSLLLSAQSRSGDSRSARGGKQGHQRTPAFIHALYRQAFSSVEELPRGGMTDVGLHTGGEQRSTAGSLVFFSLHQILLDYEARSVQSFSPDALFKKVVSYFGLFVSEMMIQQYEDKVPSNIPRSNAPDALLEHAFHILRLASIKAASYSDEGLDMSFFVDWSKSVKGRIIQRASETSAKYSKQFELPQSDADIRGQYKNFLFTLPPLYLPGKDGSLSESEIYKNEAQNLGWLPILDKSGLEDIHKWVKKSMSATKQDSLLSMLVMKAVEGLMWGYAEALPKFEQDELLVVADIIDVYRDVLHHLKVSEKYLPLSLVELKSRELLVVWVAFCVLHSNVGRLHRAEMQGFGVPLDFNDLSHLVLSSRKEWEVVKHVAVYLFKHGTTKPLFSLKNEQPTFDMGRRVANTSSHMLRIWEEESQDALCRVEGHWQEVLRKQELARKLRAEIAQLEVERADAFSELVSKKHDLAKHERKRSNSIRNSLVSTYDSYQHQVCKDEVARLSRTVNHLDSQLSSKSASLQSTLKAPAPVVQPLPKEKNNAMPVIFFLYMPPAFQLLARFSFTAQQLLIPQPWTSVWGGREGSEKFDISNLVTRRADQWCQLSLKDHYNNHQYSQYHTPCSSRRGSDYHVLLRSSSNGVPKSTDVGPSSVDYIHNKSDGIWHPDELRPRMAWFGGAKSFDKAPSGCEINPFALLDHYHLVSNFTERLTSDEQLQWAMMQPGDEHILRSRGNLP